MYKTVQLIFNFFLCLCYSTTWAQVDLEKLPDDSLTYTKIFAGKEDTSLLVIKLKRLDANENAYVYSALTQLSYDKNAVSKVEIKKNDNLSQLVDKKYKLSIRTDNELFRAVIDSITTKNLIGDSKTLYVGDSLALPNLPSKPYSNSSENLTQYFDFYKNTAKVINTKELNLTKGLLSSSQDFSKGATFSTSLAQRDLESFISHLPADFYLKKQGDEISFTRLTLPSLIQARNPDKYDSSSAVAFHTEIVSDELLTKISGIDPSWFGDFVVLDSFVNNECTHGSKVRQVIETRLRSYKLSQVVHKIINVPINYFQNKDYALRFMKTYYAERDEQEKKDGLKQIRLLERVSKKEDPPYGYPDFYLSALFSYWYNQRPDIISSSFYVNRYDNKNSLLPRVAVTNVTLITAALNDPSNLEDQLYIGDEKTGEPISAPEPLFSYFTNYNQIPSVITGCYLSPGKYSGMTSIDGTKISIVGRGAGWGDSLSCLKPKDIGCSFATPDVATSLYIAKAYWRSKGLKIGAAEARLRMLYSIDLDTALVGKYAAGGIINMEKLLQTGYGFLEDSAGFIFPAKILSGCVTFTPTKITEIGSDIDQISGIYFNSGNIYCFMNSTLSWKRVNIQDIKIEYQTPVTNEIKYISLITSKIAIKQIVKFKN